MKHEIGQGGFTLVEVMVSLVVLISGMLGVMGMQYMAVHGNAVSRQMRVATNIGQTQMEMLKATPFGSLAAGNDTPVLDRSTSGGVVFNRVWWVRTDCAVLELVADNNTCANLATNCTMDPDLGSISPVAAIRVRTCWIDKYGVNHAVTFNDAKHQ